MRDQPDGNTTRWPHILLSALVYILNLFGEKLAAEG